MVQDIKITPSGAGDKIPQILFTGSGATAINMELNVQPDSRLSYESNEGEVFSISKGLQSGVIFAVKDISGLDQISINASGDTYLSPYYGNVRVGATGVMHPDYALDVQGKGLRVGSSGTVLTRASAPSVTTDTLYNVAGSLYFDGSAVGGGSASAEATYASGQALSLTYASGLTATNASNISTNTTNITAATNTANYASGEAVSLNYASGVAAYASGNTANIDFGSNVQGDMLYHNGTTFTRLAKGTDNHVLTMDGSNPGWEAAAAGGISWDGSTANGVATYKDADEATVESNLTFDGNTLTVATSSSSATPTVVKAAASQTADLTSWQNSAGTSVAAMTSSGILNVNTIRMSGVESIVLGAATTVGSQHNSIQIGINTTTGANGDVAIGHGAVATGGDHKAVAIGNSADATNKRDVAIGSEASATGSEGVALGANSSVANGGGIAIGWNVTSTGSKAVAIGRRVTADGHGAIALGAGEDQAVDNTNATGERALAIGAGAKATQGTYVIASGNTAAAVAISGVYGSYMALPNDQKLAVGSNVPEYPIDVVTHSGVIRASGVKGHISTNADAATVTFDLNQATTHGVTLGGNRILAVSNAIVGDKFLTRLQQDATGSRTVTWFSHIKWAEGGTAPTLTTTAHKADLLGFLAASGDGTNIWYDGLVVGQNI